jgi:hypothetical protein
MLDSTIARTGRSLEGGLRGGVMLGQTINQGMSKNALQAAQARINAGEDANAVIQQLMAQDPAAAQQLMNLKQGNMALQQQQQEMDVLKQKYGMQSLQQAAMPLLGSIMQDNPAVQDKLIDEASNIFKGQSDGIFESLQGIKSLQGPEKINALGGLVKTLRSAGIFPDDPSQLQGGTALGQNLSLYDQALAAGDTERAELIRRNIDPYSRSLAGGIGLGQARLETERGLTPILSGRAGEQTLAERRATQTADSEANVRKNSAAFGTYQAAIGQLEKAASATTTNPIAGIIPAVSANAQIMEGAINTMAPVLKEMFRQAGEGTFTDKDQELLLNMVPTRKDHPEAVKAKLEMIDNLVRAKLQQGSAKTSAPPPPARTRNFEFEYMGGGR